jgi:hypothetical protein
MLPPLHNISIDTRATRYIDEFRDMSGDARTFSQAKNMHPTPNAECALSAYRNVLRNELADRQSLALLQRGIKPSEADVNDLRYPDWVSILEKLKRPGESVVMFFPQQLQDKSMWLDIRVAVMLTESPNHVVAVWNHEKDELLRLYDNDSRERKVGKYRLIDTNVNWTGRAYAIVKEGSRLQRGVLTETPSSREVVNLLSDDEEELPD